MYSVLNTLSEYTYFYISKNITSYTFLLVLKIDESLHCILKNKYNFTSYQKTLFHIDYQSISVDQNNIFSNILYIYHKMGVTWTYFWYISWSPNSLQPLNHLTPRIYDIVPSLSWLENTWSLINHVSSIFNLQTWIIISEMGRLCPMLDLKLVSFFSFFTAT